MAKDIKKRKNCRVCGSKKLVKILDLGKMPPANSFLKKKDLDKPEEKFPLVVYFCKKCSLLNLLDIVHPRKLFKYYDYMTSASKPLADHFVELGKIIIRRFIRSKKDLVVEIGGNDGVLLGSIKNKCRVLNIEPAGKIAKLARKRGVETICGFFSEKLAQKILKTKGMARVVSASNVVAHIDDLDDLISGVKVLIGDKGVFIFEVHWVGNLIGDGGFDQIYHEHLCYFSFHSLVKLFETRGLDIFDIELVPMHGSSLRIFAGKNKLAQKSVKEFLKQEKSLGINSVSTYKKFEKRVRKNQREFKDLLRRLKKEGKKISGYGAPAKGNTLFNFCQTDSQSIDYITDTTPFKQGLYAPGSHIPVRHPGEFQNNPPDYSVLLAWNYADVILEKEKEYRKAGGKFIIPVPKVKIV